MTRSANAYCFVVARTKKNPDPPSEDPEVQKLKEEWKNLDRFTKGDRLVSPRTRFTWAQLATELPCGIKKLRDFKELSTISGLDRIASKKIGTKKLLARVRKNHKTLLRWEKQVTGPDSRKAKNRLAKVVANWLETNIPEALLWDRFFQPGMDERCFCGELEEFAPSMWEDMEFEGDWEKVIESTKPKGNPKDLKYDGPRYYMEWFSRWFQLCMPFSVIRQSVCIRVRKQLLTKARRIAGPNSLWPQLPPLLDPPPIIIAITSSMNPSPYRRCVTINVKVTRAESPVPGSIIVTMGTKILGNLGLIEGKANLKTWELPKGKCVITAEFRGGPSIPSSTASLTQIVN